MTQDEDFPNMIVIDAAAPVIVWVRVGNTRRNALLVWFTPLIDTVVAMVESGDRLIELR